jgi:hypothetical protein
MFDQTSHAPAQSQVFAEKVNTDNTATPIHHIGGAAGLVVLGIIVIGYLNHRANS